MQVEAETGLATGPDVTVAAWLDQWLPSIKGRVRGGSWANYEAACRLHIVPAIGQARLRRLTRAQVRTLYADLGTRLSPKSVMNTHVVLHSALKTAVADNLVARNVSDGAYQMPRGRGEVQVWTPAETRTFLDAAKTERLSAMWRLLATSGLRRGEALGLKWGDFDAEACSLSIQRARVHGIRGVVTGPTKTARGRRSIPLDAATVAELRSHRLRQGAERLAYGPAWGDEDWMFTRADGKPLDPDGVTGAFNRLATAAGLPKRRLHDLRHGAASMLLTAGVSPKVVQERLGHASITTTMDVYGHITPGLQAEASERLASLLDGPR